MGDTTKLDRGQQYDLLTGGDKYFSPLFGPITPFPAPIAVVLQGPRPVQFLS